jgi:hypothetical protein
MMGKRNAHAMAARQRKAGAHEEPSRDNCSFCNRDMGYAPPSYICAPCTLGIAPAEEVPICSMCGLDWERCKCSGEDEK